MEKLTFDKFNSEINFIIESEQAYASMDNVFNSFRHIFGDAEAPSPVYIDHIIRLIEHIFGLEEDEFGYTTLSWWVYECNCGENLDILQSIENDWLPEDHKYRKPDLSSVEKLYDYLCWESEQAKKNS